jgi:hypothetical protein
VRVSAIVCGVVVVAAVAACGGCTEEPNETIDEETMQPVVITVSQATEQNAKYVGLATGGAPHPSAFNDVARIGCRTNPDSLMSEGPPWQVRTTWVLDEPTAESVEGALSRLDGLTAQGFERQPWTRPEPEPANRRSFVDERGYRVTAEHDTRPGGQEVFSLTVTSPCANE